MKTVLYICAFMNLVFAVLHLSFWKLFHWEKELGCLSRENSGIMQMFNVESLYFLLFAAFITFRLAGQKFYSYTDRALLTFIAGYYIVRIGFGYLFFGFNGGELTIWIVCALIASGYFIGMFNTSGGKTRENETVRRSDSAGSGPVLMHIYMGPAPAPHFLPNRRQQQWGPDVSDW